MKIEVGPIQLLQYIKIAIINGDYGTAIDLIDSAIEDLELKNTQGFTSTIPEGAYK
jgi:hypothetical protein